MLKWAKQLNLHKKGNVPMIKLSRQQFALLVALFDESENMYLSSGRSMRHLLLDDHFDSKVTRASLLRECVLVSLRSWLKYLCIYSPIFHVL